jgi:hypothetical protein
MAKKRSVCHPPRKPKHPRRPPGVSKAFWHSLNKTERKQVAVIHHNEKLAHKKHGHGKMPAGLRRYLEERQASGHKPARTAAQRAATAHLVALNAARRGGSMTAEQQYAAAHAYNEGDTYFEGPIAPGGMTAEEQYAARYGR